MQSFYQVISVLLVICATNWYIIATLPVMFGASIWLLLYILPAFRETSRIEAVSKSPQVSMMSESATG